MKRPSPRIAVLWTCAAILLVTGASASLGAEPASVAPTAAIQASAQISVPQGALDTPLLDRLRSVLGLFLLAFAAWLMSVDRKNIAWRVVIWGISLQILFAFLILKTPVGGAVFGVMNDVVIALLGFTVEGARFIFGDLVYNNVPVGVGAVGQGEFAATPGQVANTGAFFAFNVLPTIIFFSSLMTVLYHLGVMQVAVKGVAFVMQRTMKTSGAETLSAAGNIFVGQTEAPLLIKPFIDRMTNSELMAVMTERRIRHILIQPEVFQVDIEANEARARDFGARLQAGQAMVDVLDQEADTFDLSIPQIAQISESYATAMQNAAPGDVIGPIPLLDPRAEDSWGIARVLAVKPAGPSQFEDVRDLIEERLNSQRLSEKVVEGLRSLTYIDVRLTGS